MSAPQSAAHALFDRGKNDQLFAHSPHRPRIRPGLLAWSARAEEQYPTRSMTMIVPFAAGGPTDILGRILAQFMSPLLGQQVVVEDTTGAGGTIGSTKVARAAPDGYTMVMGNLGTHAASLGIYKSLPYDPRTDFEPVILVASTPMVLVTEKRCRFIRSRTSSITPRPTKVKPPWGTPASDRFRI